MADFPISNYLEVPNLGSIDHGHLKHRHNLSPPVTEDNSSQALNKVAEQFEAIFIEALMRQSRQSKLSEGLFDNKNDDNFQQMLDQELANKSSSSVDIGIATSIVRQMSRNGT